MSRRDCMLAVAVAVLAPAPIALHATAQEGALAGVLVSDVSGAPLQGATVTLVGLGKEATTDERGQFVVRDLPEGAIRVRFAAPGYVSVVEDLDSSLGSFLRVPMSPVAAALDGILVMTGRRPRGAVPKTLDVDADTGRRATLLDLLEEQVPGVVVRRSGNLGGGAYVFIRAAGSLKGDVQPDIYLDGARLGNDDTGAWTLHALDLIAAEEVSRVRVYKGASSGAGFALGGANGAIVIETNRGRGGS